MNKLSHTFILCCSLVRSSFIIILKLVKIIQLAPPSDLIIVIILVYINALVISGSTNGMFGATAATRASLSQLKNDFTPTYEVLNTNYMVWYDYAVIKLSTVFESLSPIGLTRRAYILLRLYINTGTLYATVASPITAAPGYSLSTANNSFNATCPFTINYLSDTSANGGIPTTVANITAGLYLAKVPATSCNGVNLSSSSASHPLPACRIYYSQITLQPSKAEEYVLMMLDIMGNSMTIDVETGLVPIP